MMLHAATGRNRWARLRLCCVAVLSLAWALAACASPRDTTLQSQIDAQATEIAQLQVTLTAGPTPLRQAARPTVAPVRTRTQQVTGPSSHPTAVPVVAKPTAAPVAAEPVPSPQTAPVVPIPLQVPTELTKPAALPLLTTGPIPRMQGIPTETTVPPTPSPTLVPVTDFAWVAKASMPTARYNLGVAAVNGKLYAIGGQTDPVGSRTTTPVGIVEEYDPATDAWTRRADMPTARYGLGVGAAMNGKVYALGGWNGDSSTPSVIEEYDPIANTWSARRPMPTTRSGVAVAVGSNGRLYAVGGTNRAPLLTYTIVPTVEEYDPERDTWRRLPDVPTARDAPVVAVGSDGRVYAVGGCLSRDKSDPPPLDAKVEAYDPAVGTWATLAPIPHFGGRSNLGAAASGGRIYVVGGGWGRPCLPDDALATTLEYDPTTATWEYRAPLGTPRWGLGVAALGGRLYAVGGFNGKLGGPLATVEEAVVAR